MKTSFKLQLHGAHIMHGWRMHGRVCVLYFRTSEGLIGQPWTMTMSDILWNMDQREITSVIAIDLSQDSRIFKKCHTVNHQTPLLVLNKCFGVNNSALAWFDSYLWPRQMHVVIPGASSQPCEMNVELN